MVKDISFHYTNPEMVRDLIKIIPIQKQDTILDAGSGKNKIWYNSIQNTVVEKYECEIEDGCDFLEWDRKIDWVIGNFPFDIGYKFMEKATEIANKGVACLGSIQNFNQFTPKRLQKIKDNGFEMQHIHIVNDCRWYGRYFFMIFEKKKGILSWELKTYR